MKHRGTMKKRFPGSNSAYGFFSYYPYIVWPEANRLFIIKGGPGTGKSTFMKKMGQEMMEKGFEVEFHYCSANSQSVDGVTFPALKAGIIDGTAPHITDPAHPGAVEEIVNLSENWDVKPLQENRDEIIRLSTEKSARFNAAYIFLSTAKQYRDAAEKELENKVTALPAFQKKISMTTLDLIDEILGSRTGGFQGLNRKLFISAITPQGAVNHLDNLLECYSICYVLTGASSSLKRSVIQGVRDAARLKGFNIEDFCCALDPHRVDHLGLPELDTVLINSSEPHSILPGFTGNPFKEVDMGFPETLPETGLEKDSRFYHHYRVAFDGAISMLQEAGELHDKVEAFYIPAMDFSAVEDLRRRVKESILSLAESQK